MTSREQALRNLAAAREGSNQVYVIGACGYWLQHWHGTVRGKHRPRIRRLMRQMTPQPQLFDYHQAT